MNRCFDEILRLFYKETGIVFENKLQILKKKIEKFYKDLDYKGCDSFLDDIKKSKELLQKFINFLTVSESFFFREKGHFEFLVEEIKKSVKQNHRLLSLPCSSGEEPYTILIYMLENGFKNFEIIGVDINTKVLEIAKKAIYTKRRVSLLPNDLLKRYLSNVDNSHYALKDRYKKMVCFKHLNLFDQEIYSLGQFDFVFSRNLFIYFDDYSKLEALRVFHKLLVQGGYLFLGHADIVKVTPGFERVYRPGLQILKKI